MNRYCFYSHASADSHLDSCRFLLPGKEMSIAEIGLMPIEWGAIACRPFEL